ncbi:PrgI family protein [Phytomonospora endophytica]|uniref:PrgI family protein n=1 Tax=Phytomonospora endophytica TaxID=714109 RepID=A0A841FQV3_9ACTN|nr:PrgI family protein [Phytomonospora endophytica]MBB6038545.1 hypothetical protein [Phytomonospora endophytica]GIG69315.1 hypothetical protein Pen01_56100 [Phytomonospora endophytica]
MVTTEGPRIARVPQIDLADKVLFGLTTRQVAWAATGAACTLGLWKAVTVFAPPAVAVAVCAPLGLLFAAIVFAQRDGARLDTLLWAALRTPRRPLVPAPGVTAAPAWMNTDTAPVLPRVLRSPAKGVTADGLIDLGEDGYTIVLAVSTVNFVLRSPAEQDALVAGFARALHALSGPVQIISTQVPADLGDHARAVQAHTLPHQGLREAAEAHAAWLHDASTRARLLHHRTYVAARATTRTGVDRRARDIADALAGCGLDCTPLTPAAVLELLDHITEPGTRPVGGTP